MAKESEATDIILAVLFIVIGVFFLVTCHWCQAERRRLKMNPEARRASLGL